MARRSERIRNKTNITLYSNTNTNTINENTNTNIRINRNRNTNTVIRNRNRNLNPNLNNNNITLKLNEEEDKKNNEINNNNNTQKKIIEIEQILKKTVDTKKLYLQITKEEYDYEEKNIKMRCIICYGFYNKPIMCKKCEEIFCEGCIFKIKSHTNNLNYTDRIFRYLNDEIKCPHCRSDFEEKKIQKQYLEILNKTKIICPNEKPCEKIFPIEDLISHLMNCNNSKFYYECNYCKKIFSIKSERVLKCINKKHLETCEDYKRFIEKKKKSDKNNILNRSENLRNLNFHRTETLHNDMVSIRRRFNDVVSNLNRLVRTENLLNRHRRRNSNNNNNNISEGNNLPSFFLLRNDFNDTSSDYYTYLNSNSPHYDYSFSLSDSFSSSSSIDVDVDTYSNLPLSSLDHDSVNSSSILY
jgi:hypothetical protein